MPQPCAAHPQSTGLLFPLPATALRSRRRARPPAATHLPPAGGPGAAPPAAPACELSCPGRPGEDERLPRPAPTARSQGNSGGLFSPSKPSPRSQLPVYGGGGLPVGPSGAPRRGRHPAPHADLTPASPPFLGACSSPAASDASKHRRESGGRRHFVFCRAHAHREPAPGHSAVLLLFFSPVKFPGISGKGLGRLIPPSSPNRLKLCSFQRRLVEASSIPLEIRFNSLNAFTEEHADVLKQPALSLNTR